MAAPLRMSCRHRISSLLPNPLASISSSNGIKSSRIALPSVRALASSPLSSSCPSSAFSTVTTTATNNNTTTWTSRTSPLDRAGLNNRNRNLTTVSTNLAMMSPPSIITERKNSLISANNKTSQSNNVSNNTGDYPASFFRRRSSSTSHSIDYRSLPHSSPEVQELIREHAMQPQTSASLQTLMKTGRGEFLHKLTNKISITDDNDTATDGDNSSLSEATPLVLLQVAGFLRHELPIRLAHRIQDLTRVPLLQDMSSVQQVKHLYTTSLIDIVSMDKVITTPKQEEKFAQILENIYERHGSVLVQMARGAFELRAAIRKGALLPGDDDGCEGEGAKTPSESEIKLGRDAVEFELMESTHAFLDRFYISRIGIRVLIGQYLSLRQPPVENYVGIICSRTSPYEIVKRAIDDAAFMCARKYGDAPEVIITGRLDMTFPYVPTHLHYIMLELLKNSMRATVEYHGIDADYPPIKVVIADGSDNEDVIIKVSDEGGGIPRSNMKRIWSYLFTTADPEIQEGMVAFNENVDHSIDSPLAGLGYGLPISRSYTRYFGGDLSIMSMEGYGTDCFVYLTRLGNTREPLPI